MVITANDGIITIWGNLIVNNSLIVSIQGPNGAIIIKGNVQMANGASLTVNGTLEVDGNFTGGNSTGVTVGAGGGLDIRGQLTVGPGSHVNLDCDFTPGPTNCGTFHAHSCAGDANSQAFCSTAGLPVTLLYFKAQPQVSTVKLSWATASELNFDYFLIEKSRDGIIYEEMSSVQGSGNSRERLEYTIEDQRPLLGKSYYRLTEVDLDRSVHHLRIVEVNYFAEKSISFYPNPVVDGQLNFELNFVPATVMAVSIVDLRGVVLSEFVIDKKNISLPLQLTSGVYLVNIRSAEYKSVSKLIVK